MLRADCGGRWMSGVALILIGLVLLVDQLTQAKLFGLLLLPTIGVIFLAWGIGTRRPGLMIPGGILLGIGAGAVLTERVFVDLSNDARGGVFLLSFAAGWAVITLCSLLFTSRPQWWPLVVSALMALIGAGLLAGQAGLELIAFIGRAWPLIFIWIGLRILFARR